jgi:DNA-binding transcriptional regulator of glucitol operon
MIVLVIIAACGCLALGWWQWSRFESAAGTFQNLGYALQWPFFAGFCIYAYRKFVRYEDEPPPPAAATGITAIPDGLLPQRPQSDTSADDDPALREYNAYLSELARKDRPDRTTA